MKIRHLIVLSFVALFAIFSSCRDDFDFERASSELSFSKDTLNLDTIFNYTNSQTYILTVKNNQNKDVFLPKIYLSRGESSYYRVNVDGMPGFDFENVAIRKKDSILIFVEIAASEALSNPVYEDEINFETDAGVQQIKLISYIEKAKFYNKELSDSYQLTESDWSNDYSRVIFGTVNTDNLNIAANTKVYFHKDANLFVNGFLNVNGSLGNEVIFRTDRMDERSDSLPNMWGKIRIKSPNKTTANSINYAIIRSGNIGLEVDHSNLEISNTKILNNEQIGLYGINSTLRGVNLVINNSNLAALAIEGGDVQFVQSTFANYFNIGTGAGGNYSLYLSNLGEGNSNIPLTLANFYNCIFYGRALNSIILDKGESIFNHNFKNNIIRLDYPDLVEGIDFSINLIDVDPLFVNPGFGKNNLRLKTGSAAEGFGSANYSNLYAPVDILGIPRVTAPTPGAYHVLVNTEE